MSTPPTAACLVVSMAALLNRITMLLEDPVNYPDIEANEMAAAARLFEELGQIPRATMLYQHCLGQSYPGEIFRDSSERLAAIYKHAGNYTAAIPVWARAAQAGSLLACEELAKYYEHQVRDYLQAVQWTQTALDALTSTETTSQSIYQWKRELEHRLNRLKYKLDHA